MSSDTDSVMEGVTTEEDGQLAVSAVDKPPVTDVNANLFLPEALDYDKFIKEGELQDFESVLTQQDFVSLMFLAVDDVPALLLKKCLHKIEMIHDSEKKMFDDILVADSFSEWARTISAKGGSWKPLFLESLTVVKRCDILRSVGCDESEIRKLKKAVHLSSLKVSLNLVCRSLNQKEVNDLIQYVWQHHLSGREMVNFPDGMLLELHILYWMQEQIMDLMNLSVLVKALEHINRPKLKNVLIGQSSPSSPLSASIPGPSTGGHSKVVSLPSMGGDRPSFVYPNDNGVAYIFNQEHFSSCLQPEECDLNNHGPRYGSTQDAQKLEKLFGNFRCVTKIYNDLSGSQIQKCLENLAEKDLKQFDFLVVCFLSHGNTDNNRQFIYSSDWQELFIDDLIRPFGGDKCPDMLCKMKLIITQSCQGADQLQRIGMDAVPSRRSEGLSDSIAFSAPSARPLGATFQSDFLFCQASTPGYQAYRYPELGSPYIMCLCEVLESRGHLEEISMCLKDVHNQLHERPIELFKDEKLFIDVGIQPQMIDRTQGRFCFKRGEVVQCPL